MGSATEQKLEEQDARRAKSARSKKRKSNWDFNFVNVTLTSKDKEAIRSYEFDSERMFEWMELKAEEGYSFKSAYNFDEGTHRISMSGVDKECVNYQKILVGRAGNLAQAFLSLFHKAEVMLGGLAWEMDSPDGDKLG